MADRRQEYFGRYRDVLGRYLTRQTEATMEEAYELGRDAIGLGLGVLGMAQVHSDAFFHYFKVTSAGKPTKQLLKLSKVFFLETLSPFAATHRGFQDANNRLNQLIAMLERRNEELARVNKDLEKEMVRRLLKERALRRSEEDLRQLSNKVLHVQEEERTRISRELHDDVGQALTAINVNLAILRKSDLNNPAELRKRIADTQQLLKQTMDTVHHFAAELRPSVLDDLGLIPALRSYAKDYSERTRIKVSFVADPVAEELDRAKKTIFFRVTQESLTNVAKHAGAKNVEVSIQRIGPLLRLCVKDDGKSFQVATAISGKGRKRLGLVGMQERVRLANGTLVIESAPGKGTTIRAEIPLKTEKGPTSSGANAPYRWRA